MQAVFFVIKYVYLTASSPTYVLFTSIFYMVYYVVPPLAILAINLVIVCKARRASNSATNDLRRHHNQQAISSNSTIPIKTLVTTSLIYVVLSGIPAIINFSYQWHVFNLKLYFVSFAVYQIFISLSLQFSAVEQVLDIQMDTLSWEIAEVVSPCLPRPNFHISHICVQVLRVSDHMWTVSL